MGPKKVLVIDAQGGGLGKQVILTIRQKLPDTEITAVGTNGIATAAMLKAGADQAATGENAVIAACRSADVIIGPVGIVIADALLGEITPAMALAVARSNAKRLLIPMNQCNSVVVGVPERNINRLIDDVICQLQQPSC